MRRSVCDFEEIPGEIHGDAWYRDGTAAGSNDLQSGRICGPNAARSENKMRDMPTRDWIIAGIFGAMTGAFLWFVLRGFVGVLMLGRGGWPPASSYLLFSVLGSCICVVAQVRRARREQRIAERLIALAENLGLNYSWEIAESDYSAWRELPILQKWDFFSEARHRLHGTVDDVPVEMLDYTYVVGGSSDIETTHGSGGSSYSTYAQTVVLLPAGERELPSFKLLPRSFHLFGCEGFRFSTDGISRHDAADVDRFETAYVLVETEPTTSADADSAESGGESPIHCLFSRRAIRFLADHPGWTVECTGR